MRERMEEINLAYGVFCHLMARTSVQQLAVTTGERK